MIKRFSATSLARLALLGVVTMVFSGVVATGANALWYHQANWQVPPIGTAQVGLNVRSGGVDYAATAAQPEARFELGPSEAAALMTTPEGTATAFQVQASTQGHLGMTYSFELDIPELDTVFIYTTMAIHKVDAQSDCTLADAPSFPLVGSTVTATSAAYGSYKSYSQWYCLVMEFDPELIDGYSTTSEAAGTGSGGQGVTDSDQWAVDLLPDPALEPPFGITVIPAITRAAENPAP